jgi:hypothetical protein
MTSTPTPRTAPIPWRTTFELALLVSTVAVTCALALSWFIGVPEAPIVIATMIAASVVGWRQPAARLHPVRVRELESSGPRAA